MQEDFKVDFIGTLLLAWKVPTHTHRYKTRKHNDLLDQRRAGTLAREIANKTQLRIPSGLIEGKRAYKEN